MGRRTMQRRLHGGGALRRRWAPPPLGCRRAVPLPTRFARREELMTYAPLAPNELAAVVTYLEMRSRPEIDVPPSTLDLQRIEHPKPDEYRQLFRLVGAPWLWFSRLILDDEK